MRLNVARIIKKGPKLRIDIVCRLIGYIGSE